MDSDGKAKFSLTEMSTLVEHLRINIFLIQCLETAHPAQHLSNSQQWVPQMKAIKDLIIRTMVSQV